MALRFAILGSLAKAPASGYDLLKRFDRKINFLWWASQGAIYTELQRLGRDGLVTQDEEGARGRLEHTVTPAGRAALEEWLRSPPARRPRDELILRIFSLWALPRRDAARFLLDLADQYRERLEDYEQRAAALTGPPVDDADRFDRIALRAGIAHERAMLAWATEAAEELQSLPDEHPD